MANEVVTTTTSKFFSLGKSDFVKSLIMAVLSPVFFQVWTMVQADNWNFDWHQLLQVSISAGLLPYLAKNLFTPAQTIIKPPPPAGEVVVDIPKPGETTTTVQPSDPKK